MVKISKAGRPPCDIVVGLVVLLDAWTLKHNGRSTSLCWRMQQGPCWCGTMSKRQLAALPVKPTILPFYHFTSPGTERSLRPIMGPPPPPPPFLCVLSAIITTTGLGTVVDLLDDHMDLMLATLAATTL